MAVTLQSLNNTNLIIAVLVVAIMISVVTTAYTHVRDRQRTDRTRRVARLRDQLLSLDDIREAIAALPVDARLRQVLDDHRVALCAALTAMNESAPAAVAPAAEGAVTVLASQQSLGRALSEINATRRYLQELERVGRMSRAERMQYADSLAHTAVLLQAESLATWAELPGTDRAAAEGYLRDAASILQESIHLDSEFTARIAGLRTRQQTLARGAVRDAAQHAPVVTPDVAAHSS